MADETRGSAGGVALEELLSRCAAAGLPALRRYYWGWLLAFSASLLCPLVLSIYDNVLYQLSHPAPSVQALIVSPHYALANVCFSAAKAATVTLGFYIWTQRISRLELPREFRVAVSDAELAHSYSSYSYRSSRIWLGRLIILPCMVWLLLLLGYFAWLIPQLPPSYSIPASEMVRNLNELSLDLALCTVALMIFLRSRNATQLGTGWLAVACGLACSSYFCYTLSRYFESALYSVGFPEWISSIVPGRMTFDSFVIGWDLLLFGWACYFAGPWLRRYGERALLRRLREEQ